MVTRLMCVMVFLHSAITVLLVISHIVWPAMHAKYMETLLRNSIDVHLVCQQSTGLGRRLQWAVYSSSYKCFMARRTVSYS